MIILSIIWDPWFVIHWIDFQLVLLTVYKSYMFFETLVLLVRNQSVWDVRIPRSHRPTNIIMFRDVISISIGFMGATSVTDHPCSQKVPPASLEPWGDVTAVYHTREKLWTANPSRRPWKPTVRQLIQNSAKCDED